MTVKVLSVKNGDAFTINYKGNDNKYHNIFIDCGYVNTYSKTLKRETEAVIDNNQLIDLFIITHTDRDHISGIFPFFKDWGDKNIVKDFMFNYSSIKLAMPTNDGKISIRQGIALRDKLMKSGLIKYDFIDTQLKSVNYYGAILTFLSPEREVLEKFKAEWEKKELERFKAKQSKTSARSNDFALSIDELSSRDFTEDSKIENGNSIAFLLEYEGKRCIFMGDAWPSVVERRVRELGYSESNKLKVDCVKLSHHGSRYNTSCELLQVIDCSKYIITGNGNKFPNKEALARILNMRKKTGTTFIFNHNLSKLRSIFSDKEKEEHSITTHYPEGGDNGISITL